MTCLVAVPDQISGHGIMSG